MCIYACVVVAAADESWAINAWARLPLYIVMLLSNINLEDEYVRDTSARHSFA